MRKRNLGLDIARVIAILGVIVLHINGAGGGLNAASIGTAQWIAVYLTEILAYCSVDLFGLISGYLGIYSNKKSFLRAIELLSISMLYCILITIAFICIFPKKMGLSNIVVGLVPFVKGKYWYLYCYLPIAVFQPYVNDFVNRLEVKQLEKMVAVITLFFSFIPTLIRSDNFGLNNGYSVMWLLICYIIGALIRRKEDSYPHHKSVICFGAFFVSAIVLLLGNCFIIKVTGKCIDYFVLYTSPIVLFMAASLLIGFKNLKFKSENYRFLPMLSMLSFDVYLLHCHILIINILWLDAFKWIGNYSAVFIPFLIMGIAMCIGILCLVPAYVRYLVYKKVSFKSIADKVDSWLYCKKKL